MEGGLKLEDDRLVLPTVCTWLLKSVSFDVSMVSSFRAYRASVGRQNLLSPANFHSHEHELQGILRLMVIVNVACGLQTKQGKSGLCHFKFITSYFNFRKFSIHN